MFAAVLALLTLAQLATGAVALRGLHFGSRVNFVHCAWAVPLLVLANALLWALTLVALAMLPLAIPAAALLDGFALIRVLFNPQSGSSRDAHARDRKKTLERMRRHGAEATEVALPSLGGATAHCVWVEHKAASSRPTASARRRRSRSPSARGAAAPSARGAAVAAPSAESGPRAALLIGGNCEVSDDMLDTAEMLYGLGFNVLVVTRSGYPDPAEDFGAATNEGWLASLRRMARHSPTDASMAADAQAALAWLTSSTEHGHPVYDPSRVVALGQSMGTYAVHALGASTPELAAVIADEPYASAPRVATTMACNIGGEIAWPLPRSLVVRLLWPPLALLVHIVVRLGFRMWREPLDNLSAAARIQGGYCVVAKSHDELMAYAHEQGGNTPHTPSAPFGGNAADALLAAYEAQQCGPSMRIELTAPGPLKGASNYGCPPGHGASFDWPEHQEEKEALCTFLEAVFG